MTRLRFVLPLLAFLLVAIAAPARAAGEENYKVRCKSADGFAHVYTAHEITPERCRSHAARLVKAYAFVTERYAWKDRGLLTAQPLQFALVGPSQIKVLGYASGPNLMVMGDAYMDDPLSEGTLAHEVAHIQDLRQLKGRKLPSFMLEGRALTVGQAYRLHVGQKAGDYDRKMARSAVGFTADQAMELLENYRGHGWNNQAIGTVVVEYMRVEWRGGVADVNPRLSRMIEAIAGGREFEAAFEDEFKVKAEAFAEDFAAFLRTTQGDAKRRLKGTMWQSVSLDAVPAAPASDDEYVGAVLDLASELLR
jgi:hypothetical protein